MKQANCITILCCAILLLSNSVLLAAEPPSTLNKITEKIEQLKNFVLQKQHKKSDLQDELSNIEQQIAGVNRKLYSLDKSIEEQNKKLQPLQQQQQVLQKKLTKQQVALAKQLRAAYQMGKHSSLQLFLSQQNPSDVTRMGSYYQAVNQARQARITLFFSRLTQLNDNQRKMQQVLSRLQQLRKNRLAEQKVLRQKVRNRKVLLQRLSRQIHSSQQKITQLEVNKKHLQKVVNTLAVEKKYANSRGKSFSSLKHQLAWPTKGRLTRNYGQLYDGRLRSNGVFLSAPLNTTVHAVASGTVIFANWLRGYGNMVIVGHKGGYMTLYGHNNAILVAVGHTVQPGEEIALVGNSGGLINPGLYFEIRYQGITRDPALWCR